MIFMAVFKCKMCGGDLEFHDGFAECPYCGTKQTLPRDAQPTRPDEPPKGDAAAKGRRRWGARVAFGLLAAAALVGLYHALELAIPDSPPGRVLWFLVRCGGFVVLYYLLFLMGLQMENRFGLSTALVLFLHFALLFLPFTLIFALSPGWLALALYLVVYITVFLMIAPPI